MSTESTIIIHEVEADGLPDMDNLIGRVAFIWDGALVSGWPIGEYDEEGERLGYKLLDGEDVMWEPSEDRFGGPVVGVTHWVELPVAAWKLGDLP